MPFQNQPRQRVGMAFSGRPSSSEFGNHSWLMNQLIAGGEGALDSATFGLADKAYSGLGALADGVRGKSIKDAYNQRMAYERARDQYYAQHYGTARTIGEIGGALLPIPGVGPLGLAARALGRTARFAEAAKVFAKATEVGKRIKQVTPLATHERAVVSGVGAVGGGAGQAYSDAAQGHLSSVRDLAGAMAGGALQAQLALHGRPTLAGAAGGATTSILQDALNGRSVSVGNAAQAAGAGAAAGKLGDIVGRGRFYYGTSRDPETLGQRVVYGNSKKEKMGEDFSKLRTLANFDTTASTAKDPLYLEGGGHTEPDQVTGRGQYVESKAGRYASLRKRQRQAHGQAGLNYRVDHLLPQDVGSLLGFLGGQIGYRLPDYMQLGQSPSDQQGQ